ncbi:MAG TPA: polysaccharide biosynthesis/export family protein [Trichocoleus sp.]|jgi:polysaccharide export outer membrane protein
MFPTSSLRQITTVTIATLLWAVQASVFIPIASAQANESNEAQPRSTRQLLEQARQRLLDRGELPQTEGSDLSNSAQPQEDTFGEYRLGPGDSLFVNVLRFPDLTFQNTIDLQGNMLVPLVGALPLQGLTVAQAREQIRVALDRFVINPQVDAILVAQRPVTVTVLGEVSRPGLYPLQAPQLSTAIVSAGGTTGLADLRSIRVQRQLPDGSLTQRDINLFTPLREAQSIPEVRLADGDTIIVPTLITDTGYDRTLVARSTLAQQQITVRVLNYAAGTGGGLGNLTLPNGSSFLDAVGSLSPDLSNADIRRIALIRFDVEQGKAVTQELDGKKALLGDSSQNPILANNDVIVMGRTLISRITYTLNTFTQPFRDILGFLLFFQSLSNSARDLFRPTGESGSSD